MLLEMHQTLRCFTLISVVRSRHSKQAVSTFTSRCMDLVSFCKETRCSTVPTVHDETKRFVCRYVFLLLSLPPIYNVWLYWIIMICVVSQWAELLSGCIWFTVWCRNTWFSYPLSSIPTEHPNPSLTLLTAVHLKHHLPVVLELLIIKALKNFGFKW